MNNFELQDFSSIFLFPEIGEQLNLVNYRDFVNIIMLSEKRIQVFI